MCGVHSRVSMSTQPQNKYVYYHFQVCYNNNDNEVTIVLKKNEIAN